MNRLLLSAVSIALLLNGCIKQEFDLSQPKVPGDPGPINPTIGSLSAKLNGVQVYDSSPLIDLNYKNAGDFSINIRTQYLYPADTLFAKGTIELELKMATDSNFAIIDTCLGIDTCHYPVTNTNYHIDHLQSGMISYSNYTGRIDGYYHYAYNTPFGECEQVSGNIAIVKDASGTISGTFYASVCGFRPIPGIDRIDITEGAFYFFNP